ncbi:DNA repair protein RecO [Corynebacterium kalinowskii]|uniref:DNA repair protein RecO n=1 Tax=Corynebacterium kalinowskii TaxID=2675216 RepID=A0A6B8V941_9CORY|nr:DNA repair protein RecO [Corynebacterium kalinowskii]QGU01602.1 DNA repair protein RecO [Corynebacterium kalinowskii]
MQSYRERALVVRTYDFGEADRIVVLLTPRGLVRGVAKGVRRAKSRFGSRVQPFVLLDVQLYPGRNLDTLTGADTVEYFGSGIIESYEHYTAASAILEAAEQLSYHEGELFELTVTALRRIQNASHPTAVLDAFLLQAMDIAGWAPSLFDCAHCGAPGPHYAFHPGAGGALCENCHLSGCATPPTEALRLMWWFMHDAWDAVETASHDAEFSDLLGAAHQLTRAHLQWHLERSVKSLNFVDSGWNH